jgi:hypothetical protein
MSEQVPEVPPEVQHEIGLSSLWSLLIGSWATWADDVSLEKWIASFKPFAQAGGGQSVKTVIENFKIPGNDCTTVAKAHQIGVDAMGFKPEIIEMTPERAVVHEKRCWFAELAPGIFPKLLDIPVEDLGCTIFDEAMGKAVNPNIAHRRGETICKGGKVCENIWELKK